MPSVLQDTLDSTIAEFAKAKDSGITVHEVVKIATNVLQGIYSLKGVTLEEKKAFVFMALQRGLTAAHLKLPPIDPTIVAEVEKQLLHVAVGAVFGLVDAFPDAFAGVETFLAYIKSSLSKCLPGYSGAAQAVAAVLGPKDAELIAEAVKSMNGTASAPAPALEIRSVEPSQKIVAPLVQTSVSL